MHIHELCTIVLEAIHEMDRLHAPYSIGVVTQLQPSSQGVRTRGRGSHGRGTRHTPVVSHTPLIDIRAPHPEPQSRGSQTRGGGAHRMRTSLTSDLQNAPLADISPLSMEDSHITLWRFHPHHLQYHLLHHHRNHRRLCPMMRSPFLQSMLIKRDKMMIMTEDVVGDVGRDMVVENMRRCTLVPYNQWLDIMDVQYEK